MTHLYDQILDAKRDLAENIQNESKYLQDMLVAARQNFDESKDHVTQYDTTIKHLQSEMLKRKVEIDSHHTEFSSKLDKYHIDI